MGGLQYGEKVVCKVVANFQSHYTYIEDIPFIPEYYAAFLCKLLTQKLKNEYYDIIICRDYFLCAYLVTDRPLIYIGDTNFQLFKDYLNIKDKEYENLCDKLEYEALHNANKILYCSKWTKETKHHPCLICHSRIISFTI